MFEILDYDNSGELSLDEFNDIFQSFDFIKETRKSEEERLMI